MKNKFLGEIVISLLLLLLLCLFLNPFALWMPSRMHPLMLPTLVVLFIIFCAFLWKEKSNDEREYSHKIIASRFAYFAGVAILIVGIFVENTHHSIDPWL